MIKASLALMLSHGQRPRVQLGHHQAIIEFVDKHLSGSYSALFALFDRMRRKRNDAFYDVTIIGGVEAKEAVEAAEQLIQLIVTDVDKRLP